VTFEPDIIVTDPEADLSLVIETKLRLDDADAAERQLARYMFGMRCPVGLLVTPERVRLYRDTYRERGESAVERIAEFETPPSLAAPTPPLSGDSADRATRFEQAVQGWMERLATGSGLDELSSDARRSLADHVLPALRLGEIRAGHPRWRRTGT
jgi:hypothetical protein